jgi:protein O-mannosyl-transferase
MQKRRLIGLLLALFTLAVYLPVARHGFILYDDGDYVTENPMVRNGLTLAGIKWAFTTFHSANWHPLTWLSHMADCEWFGLNAAGPHCVNALLHAANTVLVFALWWQLLRGRRGSKTESQEGDDDAIWPAAFIAALFAVHPLHVESVAWIAERKDVLSTFFGLLALVCYGRYAKPSPHPDPLPSHPMGAEREQQPDLAHSTKSDHQSPGSVIGQSPKMSNKRWMDYTFAILFFALGLMSKPMLVTWPFAMLLLDYWPFQRFNLLTIQRLLCEKLPFFALTAASCAVTYVAQSRGAVRSLTAVPLVYRIENVPVALVTYLFKLIWPAKLAVIYPMPHAIPATAFIGCSILLIVIMIAAWQARKQHPFLPVGWFWFLGTLVPVIGLVKVGDAAIADRYMYIPSIGVFMIVTIGAKTIWERMLLPKPLLTGAAILILAALTLVTERQLQYWRDDEALFGHAARVTNDNVDAILNYGVALENEGKPLEAIAQYRRASQLAPSSWLASTDLADLLYYTGDTNAALEQYRQAVKLQPDSATLHDRLGTVLAGLGEFTEATNEFEQAIQLDASEPASRLHLGTALANQNDWRGATNEFAEAMRLSPGDPSPLVEWARALLQSIITSGP